ncbi:hypothetical protein [Algoriphagus sp.]|uniref:hypothetical protein n=1 Tax=Algoriphagus sp. TaxID=1872435 RepID=UPI00391D2847
MDVKVLRIFSFGNSDNPLDSLGSSTQEEITKQKLNSKPKDLENRNLNRFLLLGGGYFVFHKKEIR